MHNPKTHDVSNHLRTRRPLEEIVIPPEALHDITGESSSRKDSFRKRPALPAMCGSYITPEDLVTRFGAGSWRLSVYQIIERDDVQRVLFIALGVDGLLCLAELVMLSFFPSSDTILMDCTCHQLVNATCATAFERSPHRTDVHLGLQVGFSAGLLLVFLCFEAELLAMALATGGLFWRRPLFVFDLVVVTLNLGVHSFLVWTAAAAHQSREESVLLSAANAGMMALRLQRLLHAGALSYHRTARNSERRRLETLALHAKATESVKQQLEAELDAHHTLGTLPRWPHASPRRIPRDSQGKNPVHSLLDHIGQMGQRASGIRHATCGALAAAARNAKGAFGSVSELSVHRHSFGSAAELPVDGDETAPPADESGRLPDLGSISEESPADRSKSAPPAVADDAASAALASAPTATPPSATPPSATPPFTTAMGATPNTANPHSMAPTESIPRESPPPSCASRSTPGCTPESLRCARMHASTRACIYACICTRTHVHAQTRLDSHRLDSPLT